MSPSTKTAAVREYHVAVDHLQVTGEQTELTTTYLGTVDQAHVDAVRAIADLPDTERWVREHPRLEGAFMVLRDDGDLDVYVPVDAPEFRVYAPDPSPKTRNEGGDLSDATLVATKSTGAGDGPRGAATGPAYISGAVRFGGQVIGGAMDHPESGPRVTWHSTESPSGKSYFYSVAAYLIRAGAEPQVIYDPESDLIGQFGPLNKSARALRNDGGRRTNREGRVNIQVEVLARASKPWTTGFDPGKKPNYGKLIAAGRAWGVPDVWPAGKPAGSAAAAKRPRSTWQSKAGHYSHSQVPGNDHWDPGAIDTGKVPGNASSAPEPKPGGGESASSTETYEVRPGDTLSRIARKHGTTVDHLADLNGLKDADVIRVGQKLKVPAKPAPAKPSYEPFPGTGFFHAGRRSPIITAMGRRLAAEGCSRYQDGPGPSWTNADRDSYRAWQHKLGYVGSDADGLPGETSWDKLHVPRV